MSEENKIWYSAGFLMYATCTIRRVYAAKVTKKKIWTHTKKDDAYNSKEKMISSGRIFHSQDLMEVKERAKQHLELNIAEFKSQIEKAESCLAEIDAYDGISMGSSKWLQERTEEE